MTWNWEVFRLAGLHDDGVFERTRHECMEKDGRQPLSRSTIWDSTTRTFGQHARA